MNSPTLLAVLAHPDDESFGIGGTLARYAREDVDVHVAIATDGVAGSVADGYQSLKDRLAQVRIREVEAAASILGVTLHLLYYRDSGHLGDPANDHPEAFIKADEYKAVGRVVQLVRQIQPQVIITHDETGGYFHPDHIFCCKIVTAAFHAAANASLYPELGLAAHRPIRLYYTAFPRRWVKLFALMMRLRGQDPTKMGRNQDIDLTQLGIPSDKITTYIDYRPYWEVKLAASAQHPSQGGGADFGGPVLSWLQKHLLAKELFVLAHPAVGNGFRETNLFT